MTKAFAPLSEIHALSRWVRFECGVAGMSVKFDDETKYPYTTRDTIVMPAFNHTMTTDDAAKLRGYVIHEIAHTTQGPGVFKILEENNLSHETSLLTHVYNVIEDGRIERAAALAYKGDAVALSTSRRLLASEQNDGLMKAITHEGGIDKLPVNATNMLALVVADSDARDDWDVGTGIGMQPMIETANKSRATRDAVKKLEAIDYRNRERALKNEHEAFEFAKEVFETLFDKSAEDELKDAKARAEAGKQAKAQAGKGEGTAKGKGGGAASTYERKLVDDETDPNAMPGGPKLIVKSLVSSSHEDQVADSRNPESGSVGSGRGLDYTQYEPTKTFKFIPDENIEVIDYTMRKPTPRSGWNPLKSSNGFAERVRRLIQIRAATRYESGYKSGKLHIKNLYRNRMPADVVSEDYRTRVFRRKVDNDTLDVCISLLVDCSGSMSGEKYRHAVHAASTLEHAFNRVLRIPVEVLGHTTSMRSGRGIRMYVVKPYASTVSEDHVTDAFGEAAGALWGNADADAIWFTYGRILKQRAKRKIIIVLSDGSPADAADGSDPYFGLQETVKQIQNDAVRTGVEIYGVGVCDDNVRRFYKHNTIINRADDIEPKLIDLLGGIILKNRS